MAAQSRLALRSARLDELPTSVIQRNPSPVETRKRTRHVSNHLDSAKKARNEPVTIFARPNLKTYGRQPVTKTIAAPAVEEAVTQPAPTPPTQPTTIVQQPLREPTTSSSVGARTRHTSSIETHRRQAVNKVDKRNLRSHDGGSRFRSELALYFADYDEILGDEPKTQGICPFYCARLKGC